jgi:putative membrane protein
MHMWLLSAGAAILIVILIFLVARSVTREEQRSGTGEETPLEILKKRYARGEIDDEEFDEKKQRLTE